jgi:hypothetical protein
MSRDRRVEEEAAAEGEVARAEVRAKVKDQGRVAAGCSVCSTSRVRHSKYSR